MNQTYPCLKCGAMSASLHDPDCASAARTRSAEPPREMIERAKKFLLRPFDSHEEDAEALAAEFTAIRTQAIEECAGVADEFDPPS